MADFILGRLKFKWKGPWVTGTAYIIDDIVKYGANTYTCTCSIYYQCVHVPAVYVHICDM